MTAVTKLLETELWLANDVLIGDMHYFCIMLIH
jgi:hypothetical protein